MTIRTSVLRREMFDLFIGEPLFVTLDEFEIIVLP